MKFMNKSPKPRIIVPLLAAAIAVLSIGRANATPYASGITNNGGNVSFILNENADNVKIIFDGGGLGNTNDLGALTKGLQSFSLGVHTSYQIHVTKSTVVGWTKISDDATTGNRYFSPGGIAVNLNPADLGRFGRIYVVENVGGTTSTTPPGAPFRTVSEGVFVVNADFSDALGQGDSGLLGAVTVETGNTTGGQRSLNKVEIGEDGFIYAADWSTNFGTIYQFDPEITNGTVVLSGAGAAANPTVHTTCNGSAIVKGSLGAGTLKVWALDGIWTGSPSSFNRLLRWDIGSGPLPWNTPPAAQLAQNSINTVVDIQGDIDIAPDGKIFMSQNRAATSGGYTNRGSVNLRVLDTDGTTVLWDSFAQSTNILGNALASDIFVNSRAVKVSPDNKKMAMMVNSTRVWIMDLTNGIPDISTRLLLATWTGADSTSTAHRREVAFDAAGNLYAADNSRENVRVFSPGGAKTAITGSGGTFTMVAPAATVSITNTVPTVAEGSSTGTFTVKRSGDTAGVLTVNYTVTGDAVPGSDYSTLPGTVTFQPGATSTNIFVAASDDTESEFTETVILTIGSGSYAIGTPSAATVQILDTDTPEISIAGDTAGAQTNLLEGFADCKVVLPLTRKGSLATATTVNLGYSGTAVQGSDYSGPSSITFAAGAVTTNLILTPINDPLVESPEPFTVTINSGSYNIGTGASAQGMVYSEDVSLAGTALLFADQFDTDTSANWLVNKSPDADSAATFNFDYNAVGIPEAPHSTGSFAAQRGLRLQAHLGGTAITPGISVSPLNVGFGGDYRLRFDMWMNYIGPLPLGGAGSTEHFSAGVGTDGHHAVWPGAADADGIWFTAATDGDVAEISAQADYGVFVANALQPTLNGYYAAGLTSDSRGNLNPYYSAFGGSAAPAAQVSSFPTQTGNVRVGALGMAWHAVTITKQNGNVTWDVDGYRLATVPVNVATLSTNFFLGFHDWFTSANGGPNMEFALYDNVRLELFPPMITAIQIVNGGADVQINFTASSTDQTTDLSLQSSGTAGSGYTDTGASINSAGPGLFEVTLPRSGTQQFYRVKRL